MEAQVIINSSNEMIQFGKRLASFLEENMIITMSGSLGAGKTTMTKGIALGLDIKDIVSSPTFTILKIYDGRLRLFHLDVYRLNNGSDDFELEEYFESGGVCVIEWADIIQDILPPEFLKIEIITIDESKRKLRLISNSLQYDELIKKVIK